MDLLYKCFSRFVLQVVWINAGREVSVEMYSMSCLDRTTYTVSGPEDCGYLCYLCMEAVPTVLSGCGVFLLEW